MIKNNLIETINPDYFFKEKIDDYFVKNKLFLNNHVEVYLIDLLKKFLYIDNFKKTTIFELYKDCIENKNISNYKYLGEHCLFVSGFFPQYINKTLVNNDYYLNMGKIGYSNASVLSKSTQDKKLYINLSNNLYTYIKVLNYINNSFDSKIEMN